MGTKIDKTVIITALNTQEVRTVLEQKGVKLQATSLFDVADNGTVKIDIEGDGIYDKVVTGLLSKNGGINTKNKKISVTDNAVSTTVIDNKNKEIKDLEAKIKQYQEEANAQFNETQSKQNAETNYNKKMAEYIEIRETINRGLTKKQAENVADMTTEEFKAYEKELNTYRKGLQEIKAKIAQFEKEHESYVKGLINIDKTKHNEKVEEANKNLASAVKQKNKAQLAYNDFLKENGFETTEERANVKNKNIKTKGTAFSEAKSKQALVENAVKEFINNKPQLANNVGTDYKIEIKDGKVFIKAGGNDGDNRADFVISGLFNEKTGEFSTDTKKINYMQTADATTNVQAKIKEYKEELAKFTQMSSDININKNDKQYKESAKKLNNLKEQLRELKVSEEEMKK